MGRCNKCGQEVPMANDATVIEAIAFDTPVLILFSVSRHFLPVEGCEGSPSRAQYIEGQPRDIRGYPYEADQESMWRHALAEAQRLYGVNSS